jgi:plastocyanin
LELKTKLALLFSLLALVPFAVAACGDDDDVDSADTEATTEATDTGGRDTGGASTVAFTADPGGSLAFEEDSATATAGTVTVELTNDSEVPHDVQIEGPDGDIGGTEEVTGGTATAEVDLEPGDYTFYCSVAGHREAGMEGTLTVD